MMLADNEKGNIILKYELEKKRDYKLGDPIGIVKVMLDDKTFYEATLYIEETNISSKVSIWQKIGRWFKNL